METLSRFWDVWSNDLPASYPKEEAIKQLVNHWDITRNTVYVRIQAGKFDAVRDLRFFHLQLSIGFDLSRGFFFDGDHFRARSLNNHSKKAAKFGLVV